MEINMAEEMKTGWGWNTVNTAGWVGALASALGIGIPALVKANNAEDHEDRHHRHIDIDNDLVYLRSKIYTDDKTAALNTQVALLQQANQYQNQINEMQLASLKGYVDSNFMRGSLYLPANNVTPLPMRRFNAWEAPVIPAPEVNSTNTGTTTTNG